MNDLLALTLEQLGLPSTEEVVSEQLRPYELGELIGIGGTAFVCAVSFRGLHGDFVVKCPRVPQQEERLNMRWSTCLRALDHEGAVLKKCVGVTGIVQLRVDRRDLPLPHLVMDRLGPSLDDKIGETGELDLKESVRLLAELTSTVRQMHAIGVLHGDIQPGNVLIGPERSWMLIDPTPPELKTENFGFGTGVTRDIVGIARTFLSGYYGTYSYTDVPEDQAAELEEHPKLLGLLCRMLGNTRSHVPSAQESATIAGCIWRNEFTSG